MKSTTLLTLGALIGTCTFAAAQEQPPREGRGQRQIPAEMLKKFDKDGDGKLSTEERQAMRKERQEANEKRRAAMLEKYDTDKDGKLSDEERTAMQEAMKARQAELLEKYDADKNGRLDRTEIQAARDAGEELPMGPGRGQGRGPRGGGGGERPAPPAGE